MNALPSDPASELAAADAARQRLTASLRLPSWFHTSLGVAIAVQVGTAAYGVSDQSAPRMLVLVAGCLVFLAVAAVQLTRFHRLNRVRVAGLTSRVVMGTSTRSSLVYGAGFAGAIWAGLAAQWWLVGLASVGAGVGYAASAWLWWHDYLRDPAGHARAESRATLALYALVAVAALVALAALR